LSGGGGRTAQGFIILFRGIGAANTARNWNTVLKLRDLAHGIPVAPDRARD
jgi:hypothetical protein